MRKKPSSIEKFVESASYKDTASDERTTFSTWPINNSEPQVKFDDGSKLNRSINLPLKEFEWNTLDSHVKKIGVSKSKWIKHAIYRLLSEEQSSLR